jgi:Cdc6-like AAA superfamily ATPase
VTTTTREERFGTAVYAAAQAFSPGAPINERELFAGRVDQASTIINTIYKRGYHAVLYGERGTGKTSLANVLHSFLAERGQHFVLPKTNCDVSDTYSSLWKKVFADLTFTVERPGVGFGAQAVRETRSALSSLPETITPNDVRRVLSAFPSFSVVVVIDEFDRAQSDALTKLMADTIKLLSDFAVPATILLIGVADSVVDLIDGHESIERALEQVPMPRMSDAEIGEIIDKGIDKLNALTDGLDFEIDASARTMIVRLSQGLPYVTHLLSLHTAQAAAGSESSLVTSEHVEKGIELAMDTWQQSMKSAYNDAVRSPQPDTIFKEVLLACAIAEVDELGFFTASAIRAPLSAIKGKTYEIPSFSHHLKKFSTKTKNTAPVLDRMGSSRRFRYRFNNPLMRPYIVMRGVAEDMISAEQLAAIDGFSASRGG